MTRFRKQIETARRDHETARFDGDLAAVLDVEPSAPIVERPKRRVALRAAMALAVAACLLLAVGIALDDAGAPSGPVTPPVAKQSPPTPPTPPTRPRTQRRPPWSLPAGVLTRSFKITPPSKAPPLALINTQPNTSQDSRRQTRLLAVPTPPRGDATTATLANKSKTLNTAQRQKLLTAITAAPRRPTLGSGSMHSSLTPASLSLAGRSFGDRS